MKIGLLGGSFDPPHFGHIGVSHEALNLLNLNEIWWLPTKQNPLKNSKSSDFDERLKLCEKISENELKIRIIDLEKNLKSSYFIDLLKEIIKKHPKNEFYLLVGSDNLINFHLWHQWHEIINLIKIAVFERKNYIKAAKNSETAIFCEKLYKKTGENRLIFLKNQKYNISSTQIRNKND